MTDQRILILGASIYQLPAILAARALGLTVFTADNRPDNPGHALADRAFNVSTIDAPAILQLARHEHIQGILASGTDVALPAVALAAEQLGLAGPSTRLVSICCDKLAFRQWQAAHQRLHPTFTEVTPQALDDLRHPGDGAWIVKPTRSSGSKGIAIVDEPHELLEAAQTASHFSLNRHVLLERFLQGHQLTCEGVLQQGRIALHWITRRRTAPKPWVATHAHLFPAGLAPEQEAAVVQHIEESWQLLGYTDGPFDCDLVLTERGPCILEMTPRTGGNALTRLLLAASDFDLPTYAVQHAMGEEITLPLAPPQRPTAVFLLGTMHPGRLHYAPERVHDATLHVMGLQELRLDLPPGALVQPFINGQHRFGEALCEGAHLDDLERTEETLRAWLQLAVEPLEHV